MSYVLSNIPCKELDAALSASPYGKPSKHRPNRLRQRGSGVDVAGRAYYETALSDLSIASNNIRFSEADVA